MTTEKSPYFDMNETGMSEAKRASEELISIFNFTDEEISRIKNFQFKGGLSHPIKSILFPDNNNSPLANNTMRALRIIDKNWILSKKRRLLNFKEYGEAASVLGEIRAYGYLMECKLSVKPTSTNSTRTPDFEIKNGNEKVLIEVFNRLYNENELKALDEFHGETIPLKQGQAISRTHSVFPFGKPKSGENVSENIISKLSNTKEEKGKTQLSENYTSILWLDFQDDIWWIFDANRVFPIITRDGLIHSGEIWYAFYGWKGAPIFERRTLDLIRINDYPKMKHEGRFRQPTIVDAVIMVFPQYTVILENPNSLKPVKPWLWEKLISLPNFNYEYSYLNWPKDNLKKRVELQKQLIKALQKSK